MRADTEMRYKNKNAKTGLQGTTLGVSDGSAEDGTAVCNDRRTQ